MNAAAGRIARGVLSGYFLLMVVFLYAPVVVLVTGLRPVFLADRSRTVSARMMIASSVNSNSRPSIECPLYSSSFRKG